MSIEFSTVLHSDNADRDMFFPVLFYCSVSVSQELEVPFSEIFTIRLFPVVAQDVITLRFPTTLGIITLTNASSCNINVGFCTDETCASVSSWYYYSRPAGLISLGSGARSFTVEIIATADTTIGMIAGYMAKTGACSRLKADASAGVTTSTQISAISSFCWIDPSMHAFTVNASSPVSENSVVQLFYNNGTSDYSGAGQDVIISEDETVAAVLIENSGPSVITSPLTIKSQYTGEYSYGTVTYDTNAIFHDVPNLIVAPFFYVMSSGRCSADGTCGDDDGGGNPGGIGVILSAILGIAGVMVICALIPVAVKCCRAKSKVANESASRSSSSSSGREVHRRYVHEPGMRDNPVQEAQYYSAISNTNPWYGDSYAPPPLVAQGEEPNEGVDFVYPTPQVYNPNGMEGEKNEDEPNNNQPVPNPYANAFGDANLYP